MLIISPMRTLFMCLVACLAIAGCDVITPAGKRVAQYSLMGDSAPEFSATESWQGFLPGRWTEEEITEPTDVKSYFQFDADGSFYCLHAKYKIGGKWTASADRVDLTYETLSGKPLQEEMDRIKASAEGGTQAAVANDLFSDWVVSATTKQTTLSVGSDKKTLRWGAPAPAPAPGQNPSENGPDIGALLESMNPPMRRLSEVK